MERLLSSQSVCSELSVVKMCLYRMCNVAYDRTSASDDIHYNSHTCRVILLNYVKSLLGDYSSIF